MMMITAKYITEPLGNYAAGPGRKLGNKTVNTSQEVRLTIIISTTTIPKYFSIFVLISVNFKVCFSYVTKISGENDTINGIFLFVKENFPICNRKIPIVRRGE